MINLDNSRDRLQQQNEQFDKLKVVFERLPAVSIADFSKDDYQKFTQAEKAILANAFLCMGGISALVKAPLIKENGALDVAIRDVRDQAKDLVDRLNSI